jgi:pimeloyl-ACP methyl ester carboxylesterase
VPDPRPAYAVIAGAGSAGHTWTPIARELDALVMPMPDAEDVFEMAAALQPRVAALPEPRVLVGASAGGMVALEVARRVPVQALVVTAAGFGITVSEGALEWIARDPPDLHQKLARLCLANREDGARLRALVEDYDACGQPRHLRHIRALAGYRPEPLADPPPAFVFWGMEDRAVPFEDHLELAVRLAGALVPIAGAAHVPFFEQPETTLRWLRHAGQVAAWPA